MRPEAGLWWIQANRDFKTAENCHESRDYYAAIFFCQQAVEKALKSAVIHINRDMPPKTHNLAELGENLNIPRRLKGFLMELTPEYVVTRYPDVAGGPIASLYDGVMSRRVMTKTAEVLEWVRECLKR